jgi:hypothetical protein
MAFRGGNILRKLYVWTPFDFDFLMDERFAWCLQGINIAAVICATVECRVSVARVKDYLGR